MKLVALLLLSSAIAAADAGKARQLNTEGMKLYGKTNYRAALEAFDKAIAADPTFVLAHYNAASMASILGNTARVIDELKWLVASKDPVAVKALVQAKTDRDLDRASMHPRVRELIGLPGFDKIDLAEMLTERDGVWGFDTEFCAGEAVTLTFKKGGKVAVASEFACDATETTTADAGTWTVSGGKLVITTKTVFAGGKPGAIASCDEPSDGSACLVIAGDQVGSFHRGHGKFGR
jgi:hypothetical protein